ncbi:AAA family ATPase [Clostridium sp. CS001]|uniref:AAA family ATPase n=1 Tax=Clostridium sp. CS001 TaxID=2880648 RepID=UPI001CF16942|nr:AAA family ATPase [Clostridium sp. CS001]MCB2289682.1 AAA family ATPase [Clostridium sp. CS001]
MKIKQLDIRDFGIFQGEKLKDLGNGIIVIGGANRSGKTSLMQILRNIPYGFPKGGNLPPPKFQYDVRCDLEIEAGSDANVLLKGFSNPEIVYNNTATGNTSKNLYSIDKATYRELFTISLDELNRSSNKDDSNLQSMLLGAGFKHIVKIPGMAKELREKANIIGGTRGNPATKMFKPYTENIKKGVEGRKKSISLLNTFVEKKDILAQLEDTIISRELEIQDKNDNVIKLEVLKHNYNLNENKKVLEEELKEYSFSFYDEKEYNIEKAKTLKEQYVKELEKCNNDNYEFQREASSDESVKELLIENKASISSFYNGLSGIKEMSKNMSTLRSEYYEKSQLLMNKVKKSNDNWTSFKSVSDISCDEVQQEILAQDVEKFRSIEAKVVSANKRIEDFKIQKQVFEKQTQSHDCVDPMKRYFYLTLSFMILGIILFFIDKFLGASVIIIGAVGIALYLSINYSNSKLIKNRNVEIKAQMDNIEIELARALLELKMLDKDLVEINNIMDEYRDILKLDGRISVDGIKDYFKTAAYLKEEIYQYDNLKKKLMSKYSDLRESLSNITNVIDKFHNLNSKNTEDINIEEITIDNAQSICNDILIKVEILYKQLLLGEKSKESFSKLNRLEEEIFKFLGINHSEDIVLSIEKYINQGEKYTKYKDKQLELKIIKEKLLQAVKIQRVKEILYKDKESESLLHVEDSKLLEVLEDLYHQYESIDKLSYAYEDLITEVKELEKNIESLKNKKQSLKDEIQSLDSDERLLQYEKEIRKARSDLRPLAQKYAIYNTAALFLEKIRENFLINTKDKLLKGASDVLSEITSGEYKDIMPMEDLMQMDFKTVLQDESIKESTNELSRGTKEQLFLAVRISRIKEINPSLPVIIDDSFVNFDIAHTKNTVKALAKLSKTHQIFVLTCHATLVDLIMSNAPEAQYFKLEKGKFTKSLGMDLKEYLNKL